MAVSFSLTPIGASAPVSLQSVDDAMRVHFGAPADPENWFRQWYDTVGFSLACSGDWGKALLHNSDADPEWCRADIVHWLQANYSLDAGYCR